MCGYRDLQEERYGKLFAAIREDNEFAKPIKEHVDIFVKNAVYLFAAVCREHEFRKNTPLWKRMLYSAALVGGEHHWGSAIFGDVLEDAGLLNIEEGGYAPTAKGLEIYHRCIRNGL